MLYNIFLLLLGIYLGQEYQIIPSIKITITNIMLRLSEPIENQINQNVQQNFIRQMYNNVIYYFNW